MGWVRPLKPLKPLTKDFATSATRLLHVEGDGEAPQKILSAREGKTEGPAAGGGRQGPQPRKRTSLEDPSTRATERDHGGQGDPLGDGSVGLLPS